jgi:hypothetical protein
VRLKQDAAVLLESAIAELRTLDRPYTILWLTVNKALIVKVNVIEGWIQICHLIEIE